MFKKIISLSSLFLLLPLLVINAQNIGSLQSVVTPGFSFKTDLKLGDTSNDVRELQRVLNADVDTTVALEGDGSRGKETTYFGNLTKTAVIKFQQKYKDSILTPYGLTQGDGVVNKATRTKLNLLIGVMSTSNSVGSPQSSSGSGSTSTYTPPPVIVTTPPTQAPVSQSATCQFVEVLVSISVITPENANPARSALGCPTSVVTPTTTTNIKSSIDIKANGSNGPITVTPNSFVTLAWTSSGVTSCTSNSGNSKDLTGSQAVNVGTTKQVFSLSCLTNTGSTVSDSVTVNVSGVAVTATGTNPVLLSTTNWSFSSNSGVFEINTNPATKAYITYRTNSTDAKTASFETLQTSRTETITGLTPSTLYYTKIKIVDANGGSFTSAETPIYTQAANLPASVTTPGGSTGTATATTTNKVLSSVGNSGDMVSVMQSSSLNLNQKMTLEAWINPSSWMSSTDPTSKTKDNVIISKGDLGSSTIEYVLAVDNGKLVYSNNTSGFWSCSAVIPLDKWTHVAASIDETTGSANLYVNGVLVANICQGASGIFNKSLFFSKTKAITEPVSSKSTSTSTVTSTSARNIHIGNFYNTSCTATPSQNGFIGKIDDVRIWNTPRGASDILANMSKSVASSTGLVAEYMFDDYSTRDYTSFANNGAQKGAIQIVEDVSVPSFVANIVVTTDTSSIYGSYAYPTYTYPTTYTDPDGVCQSSVDEAVAAEGGAAPDAYFQFGGYVKSVGECHADASVKLWQVAIAPCNAGDAVSTQETTGISNYSGGYIVIRDGYQKVPSVGQKVLGTAIKDQGLQCSNGTGGSYIGTVSGPLNAQSSGGCTASDATGANGHPDSVLTNCTQDSRGGSTLTCQDSVGQHWTISEGDTAPQSIGGAYTNPILPSGVSSWSDFYKNDGKAPSSPSDF